MSQEVQLQDNESYCLIYKVVDENMQFQVLCHSVKANNLADAIAVADHHMYHNDDFTSHELQHGFIARDGFLVNGGQEQQVVNKQQFYVSRWIVCDNSGSWNGRTIHMPIRTPRILEYKQLCKQGLLKKSFSVGVDPDMVFFVESDLMHIGEGEENYPSDATLVEPPAHLIASADHEPAYFLSKWLVAFNSGSWVEHEVYAKKKGRSEEEMLSEARQHLWDGVGMHRGAGVFSINRNGHTHEFKLGLDKGSRCHYLP